MQLLEGEIRKPGTERRFVSAEKPLNSIKKHGVPIYFLVSQTFYSVKLKRIHTDVEKGFDCRNLILFWSDGQS